MFWLSSVMLIDEGVLVPDPLLKKILLTIYIDNIIMIKYRISFFFKTLSPKNKYPVSNIFSLSTYYDILSQIDLMDIIAFFISVASIV